MEKHTDIVSYLYSPSAFLHFICLYYEICSTHFIFSVSPKFFSWQCAAFRISSHVSSNSALIQVTKEPHLANSHGRFLTRVVWEVSAQTLPLENSFFAWSQDIALCWFSFLPTGGCFSGLLHGTFLVFLTLKVIMPRVSASVLLSTCSPSTPSTGLSQEARSVLQPTC